MGHPPVGAYPLGSFLEDYYYDVAYYLAALDVHLDKANGHRGFTPEFPVNKVYHYHVTKTFPYIGRYYRLRDNTTGPNIFPR